MHMIGIHFYITLYGLNYSETPLGRLQMKHTVQRGIGYQSATRLRVKSRKILTELAGRRILWEAEKGLKKQ
jgi:hypothetical protein